MANKEHLAILKRGVKEWNEWRKANPEEGIDLSDADLTGANLREADLNRANLSGVILSRAYLNYANLNGANLSGAYLNYANMIEVDLSKANLKDATLFGANLINADLRDANLSGAYLNYANLFQASLDGAILFGANLIRAILAGAILFGANLSGANLSGANLSDASLEGTDLSGAILSEANLINADFGEAKLNNANLEKAILVGANLKETDLSNCRIYGISAWSVKLNEATKQSDLVITREEEPVITVDNLEVAQFIYLMLKNEKIRNIIETITTKVVLILGRFTPKRKAILDAIREELRKLDYIPVQFDFEKPASKDVHETVTTLARLAKFIIADITSPKSIPQELTSIVPDNPSLPIKPIIKKGSKPWEMFGHIRRYPWVLDIYEYKNLEDLISSLKKKVIIPTESKVKEVREK